MEVVLKKTKITAGVFKQIQSGSYQYYLGHPNVEILGWCLIKSGRHSLRYIVLYHENEKQLIKLPYSSSKFIELEQSPLQEPKEDGGYSYDMQYRIKVRLPDFNNTVTVTHTKDEEARDSMKLKVEEFFKEVDEKGQFYL